MSGRVSYFSTSAEDYAARLQRLSRRSSIDTAASTNSTSVSTRPPLGHHFSHGAPTSAHQQSVVVSDNGPRARSRSPLTEVGHRVAGLAKHALSPSPVSPERPAVSHGPRSASRERLDAPHSPSYATDDSGESCRFCAAAKAEVAKSASVSWQWQQHASASAAALRESAARIAQLEEELEESRRNLVIASMKMESATASHAVPAANTDTDTDSVDASGVDLARLMASVDELRFGGLRVATQASAAGVPAVVTVTKNVVYVDIDDGFGTLSVAQQFHIDDAVIELCDSHGRLRLTSSVEPPRAVDIQCASLDTAEAIAFVVQSRDRSRVSSARREAPRGSELVAVRQPTAVVAHPGVSSTHPVSIAQRVARSVTPPPPVRSMSRQPVHDMTPDELLRAVDEMVAFADASGSPRHPAHNLGGARDDDGVRGVAERGRSTESVFDRLYVAGRTRNRERSLSQQQRAIIEGEHVATVASFASDRRASAAEDAVAPRSAHAGESLIARGHSRSGLIVKNAAIASAAEIDASRALRSTFYTSNDRHTDAAPDDDRGAARRSLLQQWQRIFGDADKDAKRASLGPRHRSTSTGSATETNTNPFRSSSRQTTAGSDVSGPLHLELARDGALAAILGKRSDAHDDLLRESNSVLEEKRRSLSGSRSASMAYYTAPGPAADPAGVMGTSGGGGISMLPGVGGSERPIGVRPTVTTRSPSHRTDVSSSASAIGMAAIQPSGAGVTSPPPRESQLQALAASPKELPSPPRVAPPPPIPRAPVPVPPPAQSPTPAAAPVAAAPPAAMPPPPPPPPPMMKKPPPPPPPPRKAPPAA